MIDPSSISNQSYYRGIELSFSTGLSHFLEIAVVVLDDFPSLP